MTAAPKKTGILISAPPERAAFSQGIEAARKALSRGDQLYLYFIDSAVEGLFQADAEALKRSGAHLYACAYSLQKRSLAAPPEMTLSGLTVLSDILSSTDEFQSFN